MHQAPPEYERRGTTIGAAANVAIQVFVPTVFPYEAQRAASKNETRRSKPRTTHQFSAILM